jgi:tetratricopeptide (TPR) repeat protein
MIRKPWPSRFLAALLAFVPATTLAQTRLEAPGGVAAQTINNSPINIYNRDPEEIRRSAQQLDHSEEDRKAAEAKAADLARQLNLSNVTTQTVMGFLRVLAHQPDLKLDQVPAKMAEITANYMQMQERLAALSPQDPTAANLAKQALDAGRAGRFEEADHLLEQAEAREIAAIDEHRRKAAALRAARGDNAATQLHYGDAAKHYEMAAEELPSDFSYNKGFYLSLAGDEWQIFGNSSAALKDYQASRDLLGQLAKSDPGNAGWQRDLSVSFDKVGDVLVAQGNLPDALKAYRDSLAIRDRLAKSDPGNAGWQRDLSVSFNKVGDVLVAQGNLPDALKAYRDSLAIADRLAKSDPGNAGWQRDLSVSYGKVATVEARQGAHAAALLALGKGREIAVQLSQQSPDNAILKKDLMWFDIQVATLKK